LVLSSLISFHCIMARVAALATVVAGASIPNVTLNDGFGFPMLSLGTWQYDPDTAEAAVKLALQTGFNHIDTANDYNNQVGVGKALANFDRASYYLTTKVPSVSSDAYAGTKKLLDEDISQLGLEYVDMMLLHSPARSCSAIQEQWRAMEDFQASGKAKSIGVSNYCESSFECLAKTWKVKPAINQIELHIGMGPDPQGIVSYAKSLGIVSQAYSPLGDGSSELITGDLVTNIGKAHNVTGAQVSMRWLIENGVPLTTKTTKQSHMQQDLGIFGFSPEDAEMDTLNKATTPAGKPSWACTSLETVV
jgi:2,5-diketo-D-gluconate reductase A